MSKEQLLSIVLPAILGSSFLTTVVQQIFSRLERRSRQDKIDRLLLLDALKRQGVEYIKEGCISVKNLECFNEYYSMYKKLNGDGFADELKDRVSQLPLK